MEKSNPPKSNRFSSDLLRRPFTSNNTQNVQTNASLTSFPSNSVNNTMTSFISDKLNMTSLDDHPQSLSNSFMSSEQETNTFIDASQTTKKRKPFDKLSFSKTEEKENETTRFTKDEMTGMATSQIINKTDDSTISNLTNKEKSMIKLVYEKHLDPETIQKAKLYNAQFSPSLPFWIAFFTDFENDNLKSNSSYYKSADKNKYVANLAAMVKKDAQLYDVMNSHTKIKGEVKNTIKSLLITEVKEHENNEITEQDNVSVTHSSKSLKEEPSKMEESFIGENKLKEKMAELLLTYERLDEKEKKFINKITNFDSVYKKEESQPQTKRSEPLKTQEINYENISLIDEVNFDDDDFKPANVNVGLLSKTSYDRLLEIDRRLNSINPDKYKDSINTHLKTVQKEFIQGKETREKKFESDYKIAKEKVKTIKDKKTIFDLKLEDAKKREYKDYLKEQKEKKEKDNVLRYLEIEREAINHREIDEDRRTEIYLQLENYHRENQDSEEYQNRLKEIKGCYDEKFDDKISAIEQREIEKRKLIDTLNEKFKNREEDMSRQLDEIKEDFRQPYEDLMKHVEIEYNDNKVLLNRCEELEKYISNAEEEMQDLNTKFVKVKEEGQVLEKLWEEADEAYEPFDWGEFHPKDEDMLNEDNIPLPNEENLNIYIDSPVTTNNDVENI